MEKQFPTGGAEIDPLFFDTAERNTTLIKIVEYVEHVTEITTKAIKTSYDKSVTTFEPLQTLPEFPPLRASARFFLLINFFTPCCFQSVDLSRQILFDC